MSGLLVENKNIAMSMTLNSLASAVATGLGPVVGGLLTTYAGWEYAFFINIFFGGLSFILSLIYLPKTPKLIQTKMDWLGAFLILASLIMLILGLTWLPDSDTQTNGIILIVVAIALIIFFVFFELKFPYAIIPATILKNRKIIFSLLSSLFNTALLMTVSF